MLHVGQAIPSFELPDADMMMSGELRAPHLGLGD